MTWSCDLTVITCLRGQFAVMRTVDVQEMLCLPGKPLPVEVLRVSCGDIIKTALIRGATRMLCNRDWARGQSQ